MGPQRVLQAVACVAALAHAGALHAQGADEPATATATTERVAVIDLGDGDDGARHGFADPRQRIAAALRAGGLAEVTGDGLAEALAGREVERDELDAAAALATAGRAFGALSCGEAAPAASVALGHLAARQAAGRPTPELGRALAYVLLCADREGKSDAAQAAAAQLRAVGGSPDVPAAVWAKYPDVDALANRELIDVTLTADVPGATIWVDFQPVGASPVQLALAAGPHVIAAAGGGKRGSAFGTAVRSQRAVALALGDPAGPWHEVAARVASWHGATPPASELAWLLARVHARIALLRHAGTIEAWGQAGRGEPPTPIGGAGATALADVDRLVGLIGDRVRSWQDHAPDPDRPLLVESPAERARGRGPRTDEDGDRPTKWWVYAAIAGAAIAGATVIYLHDSAHDLQRVELHVP
jgi:hypothetical protein